MNTPTPRTDKAVADSDGQWSFELRYCSRQLETELATVTEQRDDLKKEIEIANLRLKGKRHLDDNGIMADGEIDVKALTEQRDRLAEALQKVVTSWDEATWLDDNEFESFREALQSIN